MNMNVARNRKIVTNKILNVFLRLTLKKLRTTIFKSECHSFCKTNVFEIC
jgi:hypothetical protein